VIRLARKASGTSCHEGIALRSICDEDIRDTDIRQAVRLAIRLRDTTRATS